MRWGGTVYDFYLDATERLKAKRTAWRQQKEHMEMFAKRFVWIPSGCYFMFWLDRRSPMLTVLTDHRERLWAGLEGCQDKCSHVQAQVETRWHPGSVDYRPIDDHLFHHFSLSCRVSQGLTWQRQSWDLVVQFYQINACHINNVKSVANFQNVPLCDWTYFESWLWNK